MDAWFRLRWLLLAFLLGLRATSGEALTAPDLCGGGLDPVFTVGWPLDRSEELPELVEQVKRFNRLIGRCPERGLQVLVAYGTDYELLAWITTGAVDAALLPPLAVDLARRDGVALLPVSEWRHQQVVLEPAGSDLEAFFGRVEQLGGAGADRVFLTLPSHLSNEFYVLLEAAAEYAATRGTAGETFWPALFDHLCFRPPTSILRSAAPPRPCALAPNGRPAAPIELALTLSHQRATAPAVAPARPEPRFGGVLPEWLAVRPEVARALFKFAPDARDAVPELWPRTRALLDHPPDENFVAMAVAEPGLGTRGFGFTVGEALGLLDAHGRATGNPRLALVLPGGGVKAAYQTTVLDALYGQRWLHNPLAGSYGALPEDALEVDLVTGTSGGALIGYFVARLADQGPFDLTCRLWFGGPDCQRPLDHQDIFPGADLLRYLSLVVIFVIFSLALALFALRRASPFALERLAPPADDALRHRSRPLLAVVATALLVMTPLAVRGVNGVSHQEHIPDVEGFVYLLLALLAMFADQCLVAHDEPRPAPTGRIAAALTVAAGVLAFVPPVLTRSTVGREAFPSWATRFDQATPFWAALCLLAPIFVVPLLIAHNRSLGEGTVPGARPFLRGLATFVLLLWLALGLYLASAPLRESLASPGPFLFGLLGVAAWLRFLLRPRTTSGGRLRLRLLYFGSLFVAALFLIALARPVELPAALPWRLSQLAAVAEAPSQLDVKLGSLSVAVGALLLLTGTLFGLAAWRPRYRLENVGAFAGALSLCLGHAVATFGIIGLIAWWGKGSLFELTGNYWLVLVLAAWVLAILALTAAVGFARGSWLRAFLFLASPHPNGRFRVRRHVRMVHFAVFAWGFWNLVVAPGLYGNGPAKRYLESVAAAFDADTRVEGAPRGFTAPLLVPANALAGSDGEADGARFFLMVPQGRDCPSIPRRPASGGRWHVYHVVSPGPHAGTHERCPDLDSLAAIESMIFASGSPFPVFPAHRVEIPGETEPEFLVDGGYSNNVPIAPGQNLGVDQVLVVDSTPPSSPVAPSDLGGHIAWVVGSLVDDVLRLPGYLFGRAQVLDLQSRRDFFVVRVAPHRDHRDWPLLTDFRAEVVEAMRTAAEADLGRRIARVESWGKPRFVRSWPVG